MTLSKRLDTLEELVKASSMALISMGERIEDISKKQRVEMEYISMLTTAMEMMRYELDIVKEKLGISNNTNTIH